MTGRSVSPVFVGRSDELSRLHAAHQRAADGRSAIVVVTGEAGIGKSRLVAELLQWAGDAGGSALVGRCAPFNEASLPYAPFVEALRKLVPRGGRVNVLSLLAPALDQSSPDTGEVPAADAGGKAKAFAAILDLLERHVRKRTAILVIEDLHWAAPSTVDLLMHIARNQPRGLMLVLTHRPPESRAQDVVSMVESELLRQEGAELMELGPLPRDDVAEMMERIVEGPPRQELLEDVVARSGGNPLFVEELCAAAMHGRLDAMPTQLRELVLSRTGGLRPDAMRLLHAAAAIGDVVDPKLVAQVAHIGGRALQPALAELWDRGILVVGSEMPERLRFRHSLVREAVYAQLGQAERRAIHRQIAVSLHRAGARASRPGQNATLAHHWQNAGHPARALPYLLRAAQEAARSFALGEASRAFARAIEIYERDGRGGGRTGDRIGIYLRAADMAATAGDRAGAQRILDQAEAQGLDASEQFVVAERKAALSWQGGNERRAYSIWLELLEGPWPPDTAPLEAVHALARALMYVARFEEAAPIAEAAATRARLERRGDVEAEALTTYGMALLQSNRIDEGLEALRRAGRRGAELRSLRHLRPAYSLLTGMSAEAERFDDAIAAGEEYMETVRRMGVPDALRYTGLENYLYALHTVGRWDEVAARLDEALAFSLPDRTVAGLLLVRAALRCQRGDLAAASADLDEIAVRTPGMAQHSMVGAVHAIRAEIAIWEEKPDLARHEIDAGIGPASEPVQAQEDMFHELTLLAMRVESDAGLRQTTTRWGTAGTAPARRAAQLLLGLRRRRSRRPRSYTLYRGLIESTVLQSRAEARRVKGRAASRLWRAAAESWAGLHRPYMEAYARLRLGESLLADKAAPQDVAREFGRALELATRLGATPLRRLVERAVASSRVDQGRVASHSEAAAGVSLTPRERQVLRLLSAGQSNREIGTELGIAEKTAEIHVSNVLHKLGVERRVEAAMLAVQLGIIPLAPMLPVTRALGDEEAEPMV